MHPVLPNIFVANDLFRLFFDLQAAIKVAQTNDIPKPFVWTPIPTRSSLRIGLESTLSGPSARRMKSRLLQRRTFRNRVLRGTADCANKQNKDVTDSAIYKCHWSRAVDGPGALRL